MTRRSWLLAGLVVCAALLLAFPLRPLVERTVILPAAYVLWLARVFYGAMPQVVWWAAALIAVLLAALGTFFPRGSFRTRADLEVSPSPGQVEGLALWIKKTRGGIYYKWLVAHRLGVLAREFADGQRGKPDRFSSGIDSLQAEAGLHEYLEVGLYGSFAHYPGATNLLKPVKPTPLDVDIAGVVEFLESKTETHHG